MKQLVAAVATLALIVSGIVVATSLTSSAQENGEGDSATTTTTVLEDDSLESFGFGFVGELPPELDELKACLAEQGIEIPDVTDGSLRFELRGTEGLHEALEACDLPGFGSFDGDGPGFGRFEFSEGFPFDGDLPEGFPFDGELLDGFGFGGPGGHFDFGFGVGPLDRDALASCLAELGSFDSADQVRAQLDECLPELPEDGSFGGSNGSGRHGFGGWFDFDLEDAVPQGADASA